MEEIIVEEELLHFNKSQVATGNDYSAISEDSFANSMFETALLLDKYYTPLLCLFGALGNCLSLAVFCMDPKYGSQSSSYYLSALAISDTGFLLNVFAVWLEGFYGGVITSDFSCPLVMYLGQVTCFMSVYFTVAFSIERYVAVHYPFSRPRICTRSKAKKVIAGITAVALLLFSYAWIIAQVITFPMEGSKEEQNVGRVENSSESSILEVASLDLPEALALHSQEISRSPPPNPVYVNLDLNLDHYVHYDHQKENVSFWQEVDENEFVKDSINLSEEMAPFALASSKERDSEFYNFSRENPPPHLNINHENDGNNDGSGGERCICSVPEVYHKISEIANYIDSVLTLVVPFFLIAFFNLRIAVTVWKLKDQRRNIVATSSADGSSASSPSVACREVVQYSSNNGHHLRPPQSTAMLFLENGKLSRNSSKKGRNSICCILNVKNSFQEEQSSCKKCKRGESTVRFQDCIEMSQMESTMSHNNTIQSALLTPTSTPGTRLCVVKRKKSTASSEVRVTKTLLLVSLVFVLLNLPAHAIRCAQFFQALTGTQEGQEVLYALQPWANLLFNTNFAVNFLLYCVSGRNFRNSLKNIALRKCQCRKQTKRMAPRFSWASDRSNNRKRKNSGLTNATASSLVPSTATLVDSAEECNGHEKRNNGCCGKNYLSAPENCQQQGAKGGRGRKGRRIEDEEEIEEDCEKEESTSMFLAYYSNESFLNCLGEEEGGEDDDNLEAVVSV